MEKAQKLQNNTIINSPKLHNPQIIQLIIIKILYQVEQLMVKKSIT